MDLQPSFLDGVDDDWVLVQDLGAVPDVELDELQGPLLVVEAVQESQVLPADGPQRHEPGVDQAQLLVVQGGGDATARRVSADDDVLDLEVLDGELDDREGIDVGRGQDVGDVAVAKDLARLQAQDGRLRAARVGAADPEDLGRLAFAQGFEQLRLGLGQGPSPRRVVVEGLGEGVIGVRIYTDKAASGLVSNSAG